MTDVLEHRYAHGIGPHKTSIVPDPNNPPECSEIVDAAHHHGLFVHPYTFRTDVQFLPEIYHGNAALEFMRFYELGVDGVFADFPSHAAFARQVYERIARGDKKAVNFGVADGSYVGD